MNDAGHFDATVIVMVLEAQQKGETIAQDIAELLEDLQQTTGVTLRVVIERNVAVLPEFRLSVLEG